MKYTQVGDGPFVYRIHVDGKNRANIVFISDTSRPFTTTLRLPITWSVTPEAIEKLAKALETSAREMSKAKSKGGL